MKALDRLLSGRDERARIQGNLLRRYGTVVQVSLNIPGLPKTLSGDRTLVSLASCLLLKEAASPGSFAATSFFLDNGAGCSETMGIENADPLPLKEAGILIENKPWGAVLDIDVMTARGTIHRRDLYGTERRCLLCGDAAKTCARMNRHSYEELRKASEEMLLMGLIELGQR
jgi:holo-ACP synthase